jgi:hypothetical protein
MVPRFSEMRVNHISAYSEFSLILSQELPSRLSKWEEGAKYIFDFQKLDILVQSSADQRKVARLPLWDATELERNGQKIIVGRIEHLRPGGNILRKVWQ